MRIYLYFMVIITDLGLKHRVIIKKKPRQSVLKEQISRKLKIRFRAFIMLCLFTYYVCTLD